MLTSEACFAEVVFSLAPEFVQVFFEGRRPFWPSFFLTLLPDFVQVFVKGQRPVLAIFCALMPDFGQVFVKVKGLFWLFFLP